MKENKIIKSISNLNMEIKMHITCCNYIFGYFKNISHLKYLTTMYDKHSYIYFLAKIHLEFIISSLNTLLNPSKGEKADGITPFNKKLNLEKSDIIKLTRISSEFKTLKLHEYRHQSIAHKMLKKKNESSNFKVSTDYNLFNKVENVYLRFDLWFNKCFQPQNDMSILFNDIPHSLSRILDLFKEDQNRQSEIFRLHKVICPDGEINRKL